jgi:uncharacterized membrane protein YgdD (TMEM256/DUF423 family)
MNSSMRFSRSTLLASGLLGLTGVALGAFGAHALKEELLARGTSNAWETAVRYHQLHAVALLGLGVWMRFPERADQSPDFLAIAARAWTIGVILFSGSLYWLALGGPRWLGPVTPLGGVALIAGWGAVIAAAWKKET